MSRRITSRPALAVTVLLILYLATEVASDVVSRALVPAGGPPALMVRLAIFAICVFVLLPTLLRLPTGRSTIASFPGDVGLTAASPVARNLALLAAIYATFAASQLAGQWIHEAVRGGRVVVDLSRADFLSAGTIKSGIFEEIVMRGVLLTYLLTQMDRRRAIFTSAAVFAGIHLLNLLNPTSAPLWVIAQVVWAFALGLMYARVFERTRVLLLPILIHVLINGTVGVWFQGLDGQGLASVLLGIPFFGVIPALLSLVWLKLLRSPE